MFVDLTADGRVSVGTVLEGELPGGAAGEPGALDWPLDADALEDLRWYLEDYLRAPFGVYEDRRPGVAARLATWGEAVFGAVFGAGRLSADAGPAHRGAGGVPVRVGTVVGAAVGTDA